MHEYGGGSYVVDRGRIVASSSEDGRLWRIDPDGAAEPVALTPPDGPRYADLRFDPGRERLYAVRETHDAAEPDRPDLVVNELVAIALDGSDGAGRVIVAGSDFYAAPRPSPDGRTLAWLEWDLPGMPWDAVRLRVAAVTDDGTLGPGADDRRRARRSRSSSRPGAPDGVLHFVSDEADGWWNLFALDGPGGLDGAARNVAPMEAELGDPAWVFGRSSYGFVDDGSLLAVARADGRDSLLRITAGGAVEPIDAPFSEVEGLQIAGGSAVLIGAGPHDGAVVARIDPRTGRTLGVLARSLAAPIDPGLLPHAEPIAFPTSGGATARALYFPPTNDGFRGPDGRAAAVAGPVPRRPDVGRVVGPVARSGLLHVARDRGRRRGLPRLDRLWPPVPRRAQRGVGDRRRRRLHRRRPVPRRPRARSTRSGWRSGAAAPAATRRSRRSRSGPRCSRRASAISGSRTSS